MIGMIVSCANNCLDGRSQLDATLWGKSGEIDIREIQRPFVWEPTKVRNLLDSLYQGYPVGYLIAWKNPSVKLKDGNSAAGKRILIDGQQPVTALMASILGYGVLTDDYETRRIKIAFNPQEEIFEVANPAIAGNPAWITDIAQVFDPATRMFQLVTHNCQANPGCKQDTIFKVIERMRGVSTTMSGSSISPKNSISKRSLRSYRELAAS